MSCSIVFLQSALVTLAVLNVVYKYSFSYLSLLRVASQVLREDKQIYKQIRLHVFPVSYVWVFSGFSGFSGG